MKHLTHLTLLALGCVFFAAVSNAQSPADLNDQEIAHVAYVADNIDIRYAHLALALSDSPAVREFARTMVRDHNSVNDQALALLDKLGVNAQDNFLSQQLMRNAEVTVRELSQLHGRAFDIAYAENELEYHRSVNDLVENTFIPNIDNAEVKALFEAGLDIFKAHELLAANLLSIVK